MSHLCQICPNLSFPLHASHRDSQQQDDGQGPNNTDVIELVGHERVDVLQTTYKESKQKQPQNQSQVGGNH